jgi:hypothetical protein
MSLPAFQSKLSLYTVFLITVVCLQCRSFFLPVFIPVSSMLDLLFCLKMRQYPEQFTRLVSHPRSLHVLLGFCTSLLRCMHPQNYNGSMWSSLHPSSYVSYCQFFGARGSVVVKALCYKPEGRRFDTRWGEFLNLPNPSGHTRPWGLRSL